MANPKKVRIEKKTKNPSWRLLVLAIIILFIGVIFYYLVEGLSIIDSFYLSAITLTTVGYGDIAPVTLAGKIFTIFYIFIGIGIIFAFIRVISSKEIIVKRVKD